MEAFIIGNFPFDPFSIAPQLFSSHPIVRRYKNHLNEVKIFMRQKSSFLFAFPSLSPLSNPFRFAFYILRFRSLSFSLLLAVANRSKQKSIFLSHLSSPRPRRFPPGHDSCISFISEYYDHSVTTTKTFYSEDGEKKKRRREKKSLPCPID